MAGQRKWSRRLISCRDNKERQTRQGAGYANDIDGRQGHPYIERKITNLQPGTIRLIEISVSDLPEQSARRGLP